MKISKVLTSAAVVGLLGVSVLAAKAADPSDSKGSDDYPNKAITLIVPYPAGGPNDTIARTLASELANELKVSIVIDNRPGAAGNIGTTAASQAKPDGYTIALPGSALSINTVIFDNLPYKLSDFRPVGLVAQGPIVAVAHPSLGVKSIADVIALAKKEPGTIAFPSGGRGTSPHLAGALLEAKADIDLLHVPYKGTAEFIPDLLAGRVPLAFVSPLIVKQHIESGALVPLATTGSARLRGWDSLPTVSEAGVPDFEVAPWYALVAPAATPDAVVNTLHTALQRALKSETIQQKLVSLGMDAVPGTSAQAQQVIDGEAQKWTQVNLSD
jgi:tripartite-type tricarboxylate transporter receptor subunit TctC